jgi:hypothetical protein
VVQGGGKKGMADGLEKGGLLGMCGLAVVVVLLGEEGRLVIEIG